jgi:hypothetical protein
MLTVSFFHRRCSPRAWQLAACLLYVTAQARPNVAHAGDPAEVEAIVKRGVELRRQGRDADALAEFQKAAKLEDSPRIAAQLALAEQALGLWAEAHGHLAHALERPGDAWIAKNRPILDQSLTTIETHLGRIDVWGSPDGAEVFIDGKGIGKLPSASAWTLAGRVELRASAPGRIDVQRTVEISPGARAREHVELRTQSPRLEALATPTEPGTAPGADLGHTPVVAGSSASSTSSENAAVTDESKPLLHQWWFWTLVGAAAVGVGATAIVVATRHGGGGDTCDPATCTTW